MVVITLYARWQKRHRCIEQAFGLCGRGKGWDGLGECIETCILSYMKQIASPGSMHETGCIGMTLTLRDGMGRGGSGRGTHVHPWLIHVNVWQKPLQYCKVFSLQLK